MLHKIHERTLLAWNAFVCSVLSLHFLFTSLHAAKEKEGGII